MARCAVRVAERSVKRRNSGRLSCREFALLGRALTPDEAREVTHMARRIAALILLQPELDRNYQAVKAAAVAL
jgi:hypothetical protein